MNRNLRLEPPFFEIGPKNYLFGRDIIDLARQADEIAIRYQVNIIYTAPYLNIAETAGCTEKIQVFAPHMDALSVGKGLAHILPESVRAAGAAGVMLNHSERPLALPELIRTLARAREVGLMSIVCADSLPEIRAAAGLVPDMMVCEPAELIGGGIHPGAGYVRQVMDQVLAINSDIGVLAAGGVNSGENAYEIILAGADATGASSGVVLARDPGAMLEEMVRGVREAWDERQGQGKVQAMGKGNSV